MDTSAFKVHGIEFLQVGGETYGRVTDGASHALYRSAPPYLKSPPAPS